VRVRYSKLGKVRFTSHRDGARLWERALRIVAFPVAYTEGFTPRPKLSFGLALPTGAESIAEYIDIDLVDGATVDGTDPHVADTLSAALPVGFDVQVIAPVEQDGPAKPPSLQDVVSSTTWELSGPGIDPTRLESTAKRLLAADELPLERERKGRRTVDDVRGLILDLGPDVTGSRLVAELATVGRGLRPAELASLAFTDVAPADIRVLRTHQWIEHDDDRREVLSLPVRVDARAGGLHA
jgi:radical SAM-linked protein